MSLMRRPRNDDRVVAAVRRRRRHRAGVALVAALFLVGGTAASSSGAVQAGLPKPYVSLTASDGTVAVLHRVTPDRLEMLVGTSADDLARAPVKTFAGTNRGAPVLHAGTDERGRAVVVYRRCDGDGLKNCDLYRYDVAGRAERRIEGLRRFGRSETEGVMRRGAMLYTAQQGAASGVGIFYRPAGRKIERRISAVPGWDLALRANRIAYVTSDGAKTEGEEPCENSTLVLRSTEGGAGRAIARMCEYRQRSDRWLPGTEWLTPSFAGRWLFFARTSGNPQLFRYDLASRRVEQASAGPLSILGYQARSGSEGTALAAPGPELQYEPGGTSVVPMKPAKWVPRKSSLLDRVLYLDPRVLR